MNALDPKVSQVPVSTVPAVKLWLQTQIAKNVTAEPGYQLVVCLDDPGPQTPQDIIAVSSVKHRKAELWQMQGAMTAGSFTEVYELSVIVSVYRGGPDQGWPFQRAWALASVVEAVVRSDPTCGGNVIEARPHESRDSSEWQPEHKGRLVDVEIVLHVMAQI